MIRAEAQTHPIEVAVEWDRFWGMYRAFGDAGSVESPEEDPD